MNNLSKADRPIEKPAADPQIPLADLPKKENDVSRETSKQPAMSLEPRETAEKKQECLFDMEEEAQKEQSATKEEPSLIIDDTYVLRLLVGANKQERQMDDEKFRDLPEYLNAVSYTHLDVYKRQSPYIFVNLFLSEYLSFVAGKKIQ